MVFTNWILASSLFCFVSYICLTAFDKGKKYIRKEKLLDQIEDKYDNLRNARKEMLQHYYWAQSLGERQKEAAMEKEIFKVEDQIEELKSEFYSIKSGKRVPLKSI